MSWKCPKVLNYNKDRQKMMSINIVDQWNGKTKYDISIQHPKEQLKMKWRRCTCLEKKMCIRFRISFRNSPFHVLNRLLQTYLQGNGEDNGENDCDAYNHVIAAEIHDADNVSQELPVISGETLLCFKEELTYVKENDFIYPELPLLVRSEKSSLETYANLK